RSHGLVHEVDVGHAGVALRGVILRLLHEVFEIGHCAFRGTAATASATSTATTSATAARQIDDDACVAYDRDVFPGPSGRIVEGGLPADQTAGRRCDDGRHAVHACDAEDLALDVESDDGADVRIERAHLGSHRHRLHAADFLQSDAGVRVDHAR